MLGSMTCCLTRGERTPPAVAFVQDARPRLLHSGLVNENLARTLMPEAGAAVARAVRAGAGADLAGPTPCADYDLRTLLRHFVGTSMAFVKAGQTKALDPDDPWGSQAKLDEQSWADQLAGQVEAMSLAWSRPAAWTGSVSYTHLTLPTTPYV